MTAQRHLPARVAAPPRPTGPAGPDVGAAAPGCRPRAAARGLLTAVIGWWACIPSGVFVVGLGACLPGR